MNQLFHLAIRNPYERANQFITYKSFKKLKKFQNYNDGYIGGTLNIPTT